MSDHDQMIVKTVVTSAAMGGFVFLALAGWALAFDLSSVATMIAGAGENDFLSALLIGGSLTKGATAGTAFGLAFAARSRRWQRKRPVIVSVTARP